MNRKKLIMVGIVIGIAAIIFVKFRSNHSATLPETPVVQTATVKEILMPTEVHAIGTLVAARNIEITSEIPGHVVNVLFQDGALVNEGQLLIQLNDAAYQTKSQVAHARLAFSEGKYKRMQLLAKKGFVSQQTIDEVEADVKEKRADAKESDVMLSRMSMYAPFTGVVGKSKVHRGDYVTVGQGLVTLTDSQHLRIEFNIPEKHLSGLKLGQEVKVTTAAYPGKTFIGKLAFIAPTINVENRSLALYADISNNENLLKAGMFVDVTQLLGSENHAMVVPARTLVPVMEGQEIYKVVSGKVVAIPVTLGSRVGDTVQITGGVMPGDVVITDGQLKVKNGMPVKVKT